MLGVQPGDVLVVRNQSSVAGQLIRIGAALQDDPNVWDHVIVAHHVDKAGTYWGIEGRSGGVGWTPLTNVLENPWTLANTTQPKTDAQRTQICAAAAGMLGVPYDWSAIAVAALEAIEPLWKLKDQWGEPPTHVICSSLADYVYEHIGLATPEADRFCTPWNWAVFIQTAQWGSG